ncbi:MAG: hypothetical protein SVO26_03085 [Chloroflexota bacterium]|nr:hypothetical protein [Chloroflexota bacterium]
MSRLLEKLKHISDGGTQPIGFGVSASREKTPQMLIIADMPAGDSELATTATQAGADILLLNTESRGNKDTLARLSSTKLSVPWGVSLDTLTKEDSEQLVKTECDFIILNPDKTPATILDEDRIGKVLRMEPSSGGGLIRTANHLSIDAVLLPVANEGEASLSISQVMAYHRLIRGLSKHLIIALPSDLATSNLESFWSLGARGVVVDLTVGNPEQKISEVKEEIGKLPSRRRKSGEKGGPLLPFSRMHSDVIDPDEDDEDF